MFKADNTVQVSMEVPSQYDQGEINPQRNKSCNLPIISTKVARTSCNKWAKELFPETKKWRKLKFYIILVLMRLETFRDTKIKQPNPEGFRN